MDLSILLIK